MGFFRKETNEIENVPSVQDLPTIQIDENVQVDEGFQSVPEGTDEVISLRSSLEEAQASLDARYRDLGETLYARTIDNPAIQEGLEGVYSDIASLSSTVNELGIRIQMLENPPELPEEIECIHCHNMALTQYQFCMHCGNPVEGSIQAFRDNVLAAALAGESTPSEKACPKCGKTSPDYSNFCIYCGEPL